MKNLYLVFNIVKLTVIPKNLILGLQVLLLLDSIIIDCYDLRLRDKSKKRTLYKVYIRKLNKVPNIKCLSYIY